jgi:hypothetical protein
MQDFPSMACMGLTIALAILLGTQLYCILHNINLGDFDELNDNNIFSELSAAHNWRLVFGQDRRNWLIPTPVRHTL